MPDRFLLPPNATPQEVAMAGATARVGDVCVPLRSLYQPASCPDVLLPWLAWSFSVDDWSTDWTDDQKRASIAGSVFVHRHKGTIGAVRSALEAIGIGVQVQEWFNQIPQGAPYTFRLLLTADQAGFGQDELEKLNDVVDSTKNLRSHLDKIVPTVVSRAGPSVASVASLGTEITVQFGAALVLDGAFTLNGSKRLNGLRM